MPKDRTRGRRICRSCIYFGAFGAASRVKLINNLLVSIHIAATAEAMALGLKAGVDVDLLIKAIANGSGGSTQFGIRAPWMAERRFKPLQGPIPGLQHYIEMIGEFADGVGVATPLLDRTAELFDRFVAMGLADCDGAAMIDVIGSLPRETSKKIGARPGHTTSDRRRVRMIRVNKIAHATYETPDLDQQTEYYTDILGLSVAARKRTRCISPRRSIITRSCCAKARKPIA